MISAIGLISALALLIWMTIRGVNILIAGPAAAAVVALTSGIAWLPPLAAESAPNFATSYMDGFVGFFADWFFIFLLGAIFGEVMGRTGAAASIAHAVTKALGPRFALAAVVLATAILTYGGVSVFIVAFAVYPLAVQLFRSADLPHRFIPGALAFGSVTFTMTSAGSPEIQNLIPMQYLGTTAWAGAGVSLIVAILMASLGYFFLSRMIARAVAKGEHFEPRKGVDDDTRDPSELPRWWAALLPLVTVFSVFLIFQYPEYLGALSNILPPESLGKWALVVALALLPPRSHPLHRLVEVDVRAVPLEGALFPLVHEDWVGVLPLSTEGVARLADPAPLVDQRPLEALV